MPQHKRTIAIRTSSSCHAPRQGCKACTEEEVEACQMHLPPPQLLLLLLLLLLLSLVAVLLLLLLLPFGYNNVSVSAGGPAFLISDGSRPRAVIKATLNW